MAFIEFMVFFKGFGKVPDGEEKVQVTIICNDGNTVLMSRKKPKYGDDLRSVLFILILFVSVVGGRELGNFYSSYESMTKLKVLFEVSEEDLSRYLVEILEGRSTSLDIGYSITSKKVDNSIDFVINQPDYVRRWVIGLTVSPITVNQPEASDVRFEMLVEDVTVDNETYRFPKEKVSYLGLRGRKLQPNIDDLEELRGLIAESAELYGGEVKVTFRGDVNVHLLFLDTWLPFTVTRHTFVKVPYINYIESSWREINGLRVEEQESMEQGYVKIEVHNPTRIHSLQEEYVCEFYLGGEETPVLVVSKEVNVPPLSDAQYIFQYQLSEPGEYRYRILSGERVIQELETSEILIIK